MSDFLDKYADPEVWRGLFSSGAAGRDFTMQHAPKFTLRLDGTQRQMKKQRGKQQGKQQGELRDELGAVLQKRGAGLHTALLVKVHPEVTRPAEAAFPGFLVQYGAAITDMHIEVEMPRGAAVKQQGQHTSILPPPTALPSLRHVSLSFAGGSSATSAKVERLLQDLRAYLHRLPSLKVTDYYPSRKVFAGLFALTQAPNLTRFTTDATIDDQLTELILGQTPNLTHLTVRDAGELYMNRLVLSLICAHMGFLHHVRIAIRSQDMSMTFSTATLGLPCYPTLFCHACHVQVLCVYVHQVTI